CLPSSLSVSSSPTYISTLSLHDALPIFFGIGGRKREFFKAAVARCIQRHLHAIEIVSLNGCGKNFAICVAGHADEPPHKWRSSRSEEHTSELQSRFDLVCRLLLEKKNIT